MKSAMQTTFDTLRAQQPQFFSAARIAISAADMAAMRAVIAACETVLALPACRAEALASAPDIARLPQATTGVCMGYDFHLGPAGPKLIEINTNAGGALLNACLLAGNGDAAGAEKLRQDVFAMFQAEWRLARGETPLKSVAIVDEAPATQFLAPEFELFRALFAAHGITALIVDPAELQWRDDRLWQGETAIDLVYNRLTDFYLETPACAALRAAYLAGKIVLTPHPQVHATHADKRRLLLLSDAAALATLGVGAAEQETLLAGVPRTIAVMPALAETLWAGRKQWFFKPAAGFGSRAAYRGDKLTKRVFEEILQGAYIAQEIAPPSEYPVEVDGATQQLKADFRCYVYAGRVLNVAARLYQGQTTNFRTPGGGFAPVFVKGSQA